MYPLNKFVWFILEEIQMTKNIIIHLIKNFDLQVFWKTYNIFIDFLLNIEIGFISALFYKLRIQTIRNFILALKFIYQVCLSISFCFILILTLNNSQDLTTYNRENNHSYNHNEHAYYSLKRIVTTDISITYGCHRGDSEVKWCSILLIFGCFI